MSLVMLMSTTSSASTNPRPCRRRRGADLLVKCCRALLRDTSVRSAGGEEFALLLPNSTDEDAFLVAERVRLNLADLEIAADGVAFGFTVSMGVRLLPAGRYQHRTGHRPRRSCPVPRQGGRARPHADGLIRSSRRSGLFSPTPTCQRVGVGPRPNLRIPALVGWAVAQQLRHG